MHYSYFPRTASRRTAARGDTRDIWQGDQIHEYSIFNFRTSYCFSLPRSNFSIINNEEVSPHHSCRLQNNKQNVCEKSANLPYT